MLLVYRKNEEVKEKQFESFEEFEQFKDTLAPEDIIGVRESANDNC